VPNVRTVLDPLLRARRRGDERPSPASPSEAPSAVPARSDLSDDVDGGCFQLRPSPVSRTAVSPTVPTVPSSALRVARPLTRTT
jgi:hypothetical protein